MGKSAIRCENWGEFTHIGEVDHICGCDPYRMLVSGYAPTKDYFWCRGRRFKGGTET